MKTARVEIILLIAVLVIAVAANESPLAYAQKGGGGGVIYPPTIYPKSNGKIDGWVLESGEFTNVGGTMDSISPVVNIGDTALRKQYRAILHFNTAPYAIPASAVIYKAAIRMKLQGIVGFVPAYQFGRLLMDIRKPSFGLVALAPSDFQAPAGRIQVGVFQPVGGGWYRAYLNLTGRLYLNKAGTNQFRIYYKLDDDNDKVSDYKKFHSGNATLPVNRPSLEINYYYYP